MDNNKITGYKLGVEIIKTLRSKGFRAYFAGGCVRDMLLDRKANDYDVATDAMPADVIGLFKRTITVGAKFGVVIVMKKEIAVEVATFRSDCIYIDGRHPESVKFSDITEDALRRDFTINGMYYDPIEDKVIDIVKGQKDLKKGLIKAIGNPIERFKEDYLRMLRAIRFACQLDFQVDDATFEAVVKNSSNITKISYERISSEIQAIFTNPNRIKGYELLKKSGLLENIFKEQRLDCLLKASEILKNLPKNANFQLVLAVLCYYLPVKEAIDVSSMLKLSNSQIKHIKFLLIHKKDLFEKDMQLADLKMIYAEPFFDDLVVLNKAVIKTQKLPDKDFVNNLKIIKTFQDKQILPKPLLNGNQIIEFGAKQGPGLGKICRQLYREQLNEKIHTKKQAEQWVKIWLKCDI